MNSTVKKLFDMKQVDVPAELRRWRICPAEVEAQLARLASAHPVESHPDTVSLGDSVLCCTRSTDPKWCRDAVPFYPGRGLLPAELENAIIGLHPQQSITAQNIEIRVLEITRRQPTPLTDAIICAEGIDGVTSVDGYRTWWQTKTEQERRRDAVHRIGYFLQEAIVSRSEFECDEAELDALAQDLAKKQYQAMLNAGIDPTIPEDGVDFLTEEEALQKIAAESRQRLYSCIVNQYYATSVAAMTAEQYESALLEMARSMNKTYAELEEYAGDFMIHDYIYGQVFSQDLFRYAETLVEA